MKEKLVFVGAHPDDTEGYAGTAFLLKDEFEIHVVDLTRGERGLGEQGCIDGSTAKIRTREEEAACAMLGAAPHFLHETDGDAYAGKPSVDALRDLLVELMPRAVFTHWPLDRHPDHLQATAVTMHALHQARIGTELYFYEVLMEQTCNFRPLYYVDVTATIERKLELLRKYECQNQGDEMAREKRRQAAVRGRECGVAYAEAFTTLDGMGIAHGLLERIAVHGA